MACYLLHIEPPFKHARHYLGFTSMSPTARLQVHLRGLGSPLIKAAVAAGCEVTIARTWPRGTRTDERRLKNLRHGGAYLCPTCSGKAARKRGKL